MIIEVYALSHLKKISEKTAINSDSKVCHVVSNHAINNKPIISPLKNNSYYKGRQEYQFTVGTDKDFESWRSGVCSIVHEKSLKEFRQTANEAAALYPLLACPPVDTTFGPEICERLYGELVHSWKYIIQLQKDDFEQVMMFSEQYLKWTKCCYLGRHNGVVELF
jgi:hypothetical protein